MLRHLLLRHLLSRLKNAFLGHCKRPVEEEAVQRSSQTDSTQEHFKNFKDLDGEKAFITGWRLHHGVHIYVVENTERNEKSSFMRNESLLAS